MSKELMNTKEVAQYLDIHEKQVYLLIKAGKIPCTRVTGKWIFPVHLIDEWIQTSAQDSIKQARKKSILWKVLCWRPAATTRFWICC